MKKLFYFATAAALTFASCNKDKEDNVTPDEPNGTGDVKEALSSTSAQEKLESYATEFINKFKPEDQKNVITTLNTLANLFDELDTPKGWGDDDDDDAYSKRAKSKKNIVASYAKNLSESLSKKDYGKAAEVDDEYFVEFDDYAGIYEAKDGEWVRTDSKDIVFKFKSEGKDCEFKAAKKSGTVEETFNDDGEKYKIGAPAGVEISLTCGGETLVSTSASADYKSRESLVVNVTFTVANLSVTSETSINNTKLYDKQTVSVDGNTLIWTEVSADGNHFTDISHYESLSAEEDAEVKTEDYITSVSSKVNVMGNLQISYDMKFDDYFSNLDAFDYDEEDKASVDEYCRAWNNSYNVKFYYSGSDVQQGTLKMQSVLEDSYTSYSGRKYERWGLQPVICFENDGTSFAFEDYFNEDKFADTDNQVQTLFDKYEAYWN
jgi:hypothetical protein